MGGYIHIYATPARYPGLGLVQRPRTQAGRTAQICTRRFASLKKDALDVIYALFQWLFHTKLNSHIFPHKPCLVSKTLPHKIHKVHISSHQNIPFFKGPSTENITYLPTQTMPCFKDLSTENSHILSPNTCLSTCLLSMKQRQHMCKSCQGK